MKTGKMENRKNVVGMAGRIVGKIEKQSDIYGIGDLSRIYLEVERSRGSRQKNDRVIVIYGREAEETPGQLKDGAYVMLIGQMQTYKEVSGGHVVVFVLAEYIGVVTKQVEQQNGVYMEGIVARKPIHRTTPKGRRITEIIARVDSVFMEGDHSFIPVICWQECAEKAAEYQEGEEIVLRGRLQSREYIKCIENGREIRTTYEVSASFIKRIGETDSENKNNHK